MQLTANTIALVTGATRGVGKGIAIALAQAGATVYFTGRTEAPRERGLAGSLADTQAAIDALGQGQAEHPDGNVGRSVGRGIGVRVDHTLDSEVEALFARIEREHGRLDILVNNVFAVPRGKVWGAPFWERPAESIAQWDTMHSVGLRSHFVASVYAAPLMVGRQSAGLIANISSFGGKSFQLNVAYGVGKAGVDRLARDMAHDLRPHGVTAVSLYPGIVRTERILRDQEHLPFDLAVSESPEFTGRAIVALANDPARIERTGQILVVAELAREYGFTDTDGSQPPSLRRPKET